ncbi:hypothetical protein OIU79_031247 [Salix purpurea]|uniref:Uncharacterized protein n=1 Tax=Salix purpurea TaxID=77065 RepID=A0A9Q0ZSL9_SALPP|nr:hypothetical protein OIU79_031247 [Salix purpurea]
MSELEKLSPYLGLARCNLPERIPYQCLAKVPSCSVCQFFSGRANQIRDFTGSGYALVPDVYDFCSDDLRKKIEAPRRILRVEEVKKAGLKDKVKSSGSKNNDGIVE